MGSSKPILRIEPDKKDPEQFDEIVCEPCYVHVEKMSPESVWMGITHGEVSLRVWFQSKSPIKMTVEKE